LNGVGSFDHALPRGAQTPFGEDRPDEQVGVEENAPGAGRGEGPISDRSLRALRAAVARRSPRRP
jgi:hypothetical protein